MKTAYLFLLAILSILSLQGERMNPNRTIKVGNLYKHYKGKTYKVIALARSTDNPDDIRVIYESLYDCPTYGSHQIWDRSYDEFAGTIVIDGKEQQRFADMA